MVHGLRCTDGTSRWVPTHCHRCCPKSHRGEVGESGDFGSTESPEVGTRVLMVEEGATDRCRSTFGCHRSTPGKGEGSKSYSTSVRYDGGRGVVVCTSPRRCTSSRGCYGRGKCWECWTYLC